MHDSVRAVTAIQITNGNIRSYARYTRTGALEFRDENTAVGIPTCLYGKLYEYSRTGTEYCTGTVYLGHLLYAADQCTGRGLSTATSFVLKVDQGQYNTLYCPWVDLHAVCFRL